MNKTTPWRIAFSLLLVAVLSLAFASISFAKAAPPPCDWIGNCPVDFCPAGSSGTFIGTCSEYEPCTNCYRDCKVYNVSGSQCKQDCDYR